jgi:hypothetical protein
MLEQVRSARRILATGASLSQTATTWNVRSDRQRERDAFGRYLEQPHFASPKQDLDLMLWRYLGVK